MTGREKELLELVKKLGQAHPRTIGKELGFTSDHAEILCNEMVRMGYLEKKGRIYKVK